MNIHHPAGPARPLCTLLVLAALLLTGCASGDEEGVTSTSGDPEADQRAEILVGGKDDGKGKDDNRTLYQRLGGSAGISRIVDDVAHRVIADPRVNFERKNVRVNWFGTKHKAWDPSPANVERFKLHMVEFLTLSSGGPADYTGRDMRALHRGMRITNNEFDAMVGDIKTSMEALGVGKREIRDLLAIIETTRKQIVENQ